jgi:hypothetical protein
LKPVIAPVTVAAVEAPPCVTAITITFPSAHSATSAVTPRCPCTKATPLTAACASSTATGVGASAHESPPCP